MREPRQQFHQRPGGRRVLLALSFGAIGILLAVVVLAGLGTFFIVSNGQPSAINNTSDLPRELVLCAHFQAGRMVAIDHGKSGKQYHIEGDCPVSQLELHETYISDLEYAGWTVHADDAGNLAGYRYSSRELIGIVTSESSSSPNGTTVTIEMTTEQSVPPGFPAVPSSSPSVSPTR